MSFDPADCLRQATSRAKSDVANKLISMFLHEVSRNVCATLGLKVNDDAYAHSVSEFFASHCCYCGTPLEKDRVAVEHLEGMNRFRVGLHIPGNVVLSCKRCNIEKRRDDQQSNLAIAPTGWESFLGHTQLKCRATCKSCKYWINRWPDSNERNKMLELSASKITDFRSNYPIFHLVAGEAKRLLPKRLDRLYRECQEFAAARIRDEVLVTTETLLSHVVIAKGTGLGPFLKVRRVRKTFL